ncbi:MAG: type II secretion system secretin GspD [Sedimentisphaerales bacterium]|nr:type II secretion system secretin GspD [Sedimentisphaerales bacterium]
MRGMNMIILTAMFLSCWFLTSGPAGAQDDPAAAPPDSAQLAAAADPNGPAAAADPNATALAPPAPPGPTESAEDTEPSAPALPAAPTAPDLEVVEEIKIVPNGDNKIMMNFKNATLASILDHLSQVAGLVVVMDTEIDGRMTLISRQPLTLPETISLINSVLIERNYAAIRMGRILKVVPLDQAKQMNIPVRQGGNPEDVIPSDEIVTHVVPIRYAKADRLREQLTPLLPSYANIVANAETNTLVITDTTANIRRMIEIVRAVDTQMAGITDVRVFHLKYSDATNVATLINEIFETDQQTSSRNQQQNQNPFERMMRGRGGDRGPGSSSSSEEATVVVGIKAAADTYTNTLVVTGPPDMLRLIETIIKDIDSNPMEEQTVLIYPLQNAQAANIQEVLNNLFQEMQQMLTGGTSTGGRGGITGRGGFGGFGGTQNRSTTLSAAAGDLVGQVYFEADEDTNSILAIAASKHFDKIKLILKELDKPVPQVLIKVLLAEVTHDNSLDLGVEFSLLNLRSSGGSTSTSTDFGVAVLSGGLVVQTLEGDLDVTLRALETQGKLNILSRPYILTSNNQAATITVGEEVPFIRNTRTTETGQTINTIEYEDIGIILEVTPTINPEGLVTMDVRPEISTTTAKTVPISETVDAAVFAKRSSESRVAIRDGQTIVIGGLVQDREVETVDKVPLLGDIPLVGLLFQRRQSETQKTELLIFLTPHVALKDQELRKITDRENARSHLFQNPSEFPAFEEHFEAMLLREEEGSSSALPKSEPTQLNLREE